LRSDNFFYLSSLMAHNYENFLRLKRLSGSADVGDQGQATKFVQDLGALGSHSCSQACGQYEYF